MMVNLEGIKSIVKGVAPKYGLTLLVLFGSQARRKTHPKSDVDLGFVSLEKMGLKEIAKMQFDFSRQLKIRNLEMTDLKNSPPLLLKNVAKDSILLYEGAPALFERFKIYGLKRFMEAKPLLQLRALSLKKFLQTI